MKKRALFAVSSLWLWHATRTLTIIEYFIKKWYGIDIISYWDSLNYLKKELASENTLFISFRDYPEIERGSWSFFYYIYLFFDLIKTDFIIKKERKFLEKIEKNYDFIFSDWRYWFYSEKIPSYFLSHQLSFHVPKWFKIFQKFIDFYNIRTFKKFRKIFIPDYKSEKYNLAWDLSHPSRIKKINYSYVWILSSFYNKKWIKSKQDIDYLFSITGYIKDSKKKFLEKNIKTASKLDWKKVFILGDTKNKYKNKWENIKIYPYVFGKEKYNIFNNSKIIISKAGYTTIMDMIEIDKKSILFPTIWQTEQEYLSRYLKNKWLFVMWEEKDDIKELIKKVNKLKKHNFKTKTKEALEDIFSQIKSDLIF